MAGSLAAAHELVGPRFAVTVYEPTALGGKARSMPVAGTGEDGRRDLPAEHGFRFFPGFYHHVPDTMRRTPYGKNPHGVRDNLVDATGSKFLRAATAPTRDRSGGLDYEQLAHAGRSAPLPDGRRALHARPPRAGLLRGPADGLRPAATSAASASGAREAGGLHRRPRTASSAEYKTVLAAGLNAQPCRGEEEGLASTRTIGNNSGEAFVDNIMGRGNDGSVDRVLDLPHERGLIDPRVRHLGRSTCGSS